ncbi:DNA-methyltransferase [Corallococcus silvisoli]|uniref:DNA-methyltransferase n=1 Tax=Corallococcus silvisoli TaxID=2697031 RepID=UPI001377C748|nr:site-specific DNA-methyltransferase [Corallococcus silvisoli]NBD11809.1 site-specific DNA-methyltransferase [Corallococcus silvisoli]
MSCPRPIDAVLARAARWTVEHGLLQDVLPTLPAESVDAVVTDPPYELGFMGKGWDRSGIAFDPATWAAVLRVLKPGGHLLAFGGSRTFHRVACAIEATGLEVRDTLSWLYGTGFPKSLNVGEGRGTALKPAWEPIILARKPLVGTVAANVEAHGTGALNIDACRIAYAGADDMDNARVPQPAFNSSSGLVYNMQTGTGRNGEMFDPGKGRWPANVVLDEEAAAALDASDNHSPGAGPSRFFYTAKASRAERDAGCESLPARTGAEATDSEEGQARLNSPRTGAGRTGGARNIHPTVKPVALMRWLVRLVTPPGGVVLDPFAGSGSTGVAALREGRRFVGVEQSGEYVEIARCRLAHGAPDDAQGDLFAGGAP